MGETTYEASNFDISVKEKSIAFLNDVEIAYKAEGRADRKLTDQRGSRSKIVNRAIISVLEDLQTVHYVYDSEKQLWTSKKIDAINVEIPKSNFPGKVTDALRGEGTIMVKITPNETTPSLNLSDFSQYYESNYWMEENKSLRTIFELITSHGALENGFCQTKNGKFYGPEEPFTRGLMVRKGCKKGVQFIKDPNNETKVKPVLTMDATKKIFYPSNRNFLEVFKSFCPQSTNFQEAEILFRNLQFVSVVNRARILTFKKFGLTSRKIRLDFQENNIPLSQYYQEAYSITLRDLDSPVAIMSNANGDFPLELLQILPDQEVPVSQLPAQLENTQKQLNLMKPHVRYSEILSVLRSLNLNNPTSKAFGIRVADRMIQVNCEALPKPQVEASMSLTLDSDNGTFRFANKTKYVVPTKVKKWAIIASEDKLMQNFATNLRNTLNRRGLNLPPPTIEICQPGLQSWRNCIDNLKENGIQYFVVVEDDFYSDLKLLEEHYIHGIVTQNVNWEIARKVANDERGSGQIVENICFKFNIKNSGLNHKITMNPVARQLDLNNGKILILGLDVNHPTGDNYRGEQTQPSIVGFTANYANNPNAFMGDFFFQKPRQENIDPTKLQNYVTMVYGKLRKNGRDCPTHVVILRDGVSEGQYKMVIDEEFEAIKTAASKFGQKPPQFTLMILTKTHNTRHFLKKNSGIQSLAPGSFINEGVRMGLMQFYFAAHKAIQGSCQDILVTVLVNESGMSKETAKHFIHGLCYLHQICTAPISLPEPVYQADKLAERGMLVYKAAKENQLVNGSETFDHLDSQFSYGKGTLPDIRYTA